MIASLPMYDRPEAAAANDRFWQAVRAALGHGPERLTRGGDPWDHWQSPDLLLSQTCGYPYRTRLHGRVQLVAAPDHGLEGCPAGHYNSVLVVRRDDPRADPADFADARIAYNDPLSQSGWAAPQNLARSLGFVFRNPVATGAHAASARAVAENRADIAALDAVSWAMIRRHDGCAAGLRIIARTPPTPALPYITGPRGDAPALRSALRAAVDALSAGDRQTLCLTGIHTVPHDAYLAVPNPPPPPPFRPRPAP